MSRKYERKTLRASWSAKDLEEAMEKVRTKELGTNEAARIYNIPSRTLRRHLLSGKSKGPLGRKPVFDEQYEKKLVAHIKKLELVGFAPDRKDVKEMAFQLAEKLNIKNPFSKESKVAGDVWFKGFMLRNSELSQRKSEGLSLARAYGVNRKDIKDFFDVLQNIYEENDFLSHPEDVYNMDETGIQINNKPGKVVASKGAKDVYTLTSCEKGENVTIIACCNASGNFLPPVLIFKGTYEKPEFRKDLPPGSDVFMNKKSSYINSDLFMRWFENVFLRHKSSRKTLLILDGHSSHSNNIRLLEVAKENDVILLCLPSHTTHALQPLDRAFFRPMKVYFQQEAKTWMINNKEKRLTRYDVSKLIAKAWGKAATVSNGVSALKCCGIFPFNPNAIPDHYFALSDALEGENLVEVEANRNDIDLFEAVNQHDIDRTPSPSVLDDIQVPIENCPPTDIQGKFSNIDVVGSELDLTEVIANTRADSLDTNTIFEPMPGPSGLNKFNEKPKQSKRIQQENTPKKVNDILETKETPTKTLKEIHPIPKLPAMASKKKQKAIVLTSPDHINKIKLATDRRKNKEDKSKVLGGKRTKKESKQAGSGKKKKLEKMKSAKGKKGKKKKPLSSSESNSEDEYKKSTTEEEISEEDGNKCKECTEDYYHTQSTDDWIRCTFCLGWLHESCTMYSPLCNFCGRKAKRESLKK